MKNLIYFVLIFLIPATSIATSISLKNDIRARRDIEAKEALKTLNFLYKGRGMVISPDLVKFYDIMKERGMALGDNSLLHQRWGLNIKDKEIKGFFSIPYKKMQMGVLGCVACHSAKAAGKYIIGLGNKNIDVGQIGKDAYLAQFIWGGLPRRNNPEFKEIHKRAMHFTKILKNKKINNLSQGLVPTSLVKTWFYEQAGKEIPKDFGRGQVKVPHLWGYGQKRKSGSFWDGFADGVLPGWAVAVELRGGQSPENVREYEHKVHHAEDMLSDLLPPKYPFEVNPIMAKRGRELFNQTCYKCHGTYERDEKGHPIYKEARFIPHQVVKTDEERLDFVTDEFLKLIDLNPLNDLIKYKSRKNRRGYVAQRLWGIWSRFPYLHNASVPTLYDLLTPASKRPHVFDLRQSGEEHRFDKEKLGLNIERNLNSPTYKELLKRAKRGKRDVYTTKRVGHKNVGHEFSFYSKLTHQDRLDLIEYLKTL